MSEKKMVSFDKAMALVLGRARLLGTERADIGQALNRILAEDVVCDRDLPPFDKSAMDGFACRREDLGNELTVVESIQAGQAPARRIGRNECARIMTGAVVAEGADCVVMLEDTQQTAEGAIRFVGKITADNICVRGEDVKKGEVVLHRGLRLAPQHIAVLASAGCVSPCVARQPRVGVVATGDELVEPSVVPDGPCIRNSNSVQLLAQLESMGARAEYYGIARDTTEALNNILDRALAKSDVLLVSGGVAAGDFDLVPEILASKGVRLLFEKVAVKPGMPTIFGARDNVFCFGLPGNPVSTFVIFEVLVKPFLFKLMGHDYRPLVIPLRLEKAYVRSKPERDCWVPVKRVSPGGVVAMEYHGPAHQGALSDADGLMCVRDGVSEVPKGAVVDVRSIQPQN